MAIMLSPPVGALRACPIKYVNAEVAYLGVILEAA